MKTSLPCLIAISRTASVDLVSNFTCACAAPVPSANVSKKSSFFIRIEFSGDGCKNRTGRLKNGF